MGKVLPLIGEAMLEDDDNDDRILYNEFMDAHGLLCELEDEINKFT